MNLQEIKIHEYIKLLKDGTDTNRINEINEALNSMLIGVSGRFDLELFQMQKDMILFQCKYLLAMFEFDSAKMKY